MGTINGSSVFPEHKSTNQYYAFLENMFTLLPDEKTLFGYNAKLKQFQTEDITLNISAEKIQSCTSKLTSIIFNKRLEVLLGGYDNGELIQYRKDLYGKWGEQVNYGNIQIGSIWSIDQVNCIAVMGGISENRTNIKIMDMNLSLIHI